MSTLLKISFAVVYFALACSSCMGQDLVVAPSDFSRYKLSNIRYENDRFGRSAVAVDYRRTKKGKGVASLSGKTDDGPLRVMGATVNDESGKLSFHFIGGRGGKNVELYLAVSDSGGVRYLVSNTVRLGNPGPATKARQLNAEDKAKIAKAKSFATPPSKLPDSYLPVTGDTVLVPGMPLKAGHYEEWKNAEVISLRTNGSVAVKYEGQPKLLDRSRDKWLAVAPDVLAEAKANPEKFSPSIKVLPGGSQQIPAGAIPLPADITLPPGTPLLLDYHNHKWHKVFVINESFGKIKIRYEGYSDSWDKALPRNKFLIEETTQKELSNPDLVKAFAKNLGSSSSSGGTIKSGRRISTRSRPINISIPPNAQVIPKDLAIPPGTPLAACWARKWNEVTALEENEDGSIFVKWESFGSEYDMTRDQLIIEDKTVKKLLAEAAQESGQSEDDLRKTLRTWTDASGSHKVEAKYVSRNEKEVTLKTDAGREIVLPIDKLCEKDRELLSKIKAKVANPFE